MQGNSWCPAGPVRGQRFGHRLAPAAVSHSELSM